MCVHVPTAALSGHAKPHRAVRHTTHVPPSVAHPLTAPCFFAAAFEYSTRHDITTWVNRVDVEQSYCCKLLLAMDWPPYPPGLQAAEDETDLSHFGDINFPFDPSHFALPQSHPSDLFLDPPHPSRLPAVEPLPSPHLPTFDPPSWPTTSPPSPTASTTSASSASSFSHSSDTSSHSDNSTFSPTPHPPTTSSPPTKRTPTIPATLAVSPTLLQRLNPPPPSPPTTNTSTTPSHSPLTTRRKRTAGLTAQQRAELKRQKHREIDANRIQREKAAVKKLTVLTTTSNSLQQLSSGGRDEIVEEEEEEEVEEVEGRRDKVTVLEDSARKIYELQRLVSRLTDACDAQQANNRTLVLQLQLAIRQQPPPLLSSPRSSSSALSSSAASSDSSHPLSLLPSLVSQRLDAHIGSASLHSSWFVSSSVAIAVIRVSTGCVLDVNDRLLHESGWQRPHIVGRLMCPPYDLIIARESYTEQSFLDLSPQRILVDGPDGRLVPARTQRQYERSKVLIQELYRGDKQHIFCVFRYQMKDGRVYEVQSTVWTTSWLEERGKDGVVRRKPESVFMVCSYPDAVIVDEAPK